MARTFNKTSQYASYGSPVVTAVPLTMACWAKPSSTSGNQSLMGVFGSTGGGPANDSFELLISATDFLVRTRGGGSGGANATVAGAVTSGSFQHFCGVYAANNARAGYVNGGSKATDTTSRTPGTMATTAFGTDPSGPTNYFGGDLAEAAIWNVALTDDEVAAIGKGFSPLLVRPTSLIAYWKFMGAASPEPDAWNGRYDMTLTNAPSKADHTRIYYQG